MTARYNEWLPPCLLGSRLEPEETNMRQGFSYKLSVISLWPDHQDEERIWAFQLLNVYSIVAALGWPAAASACASPQQRWISSYHQAWFCRNQHHHSAEARGSNSQPRWSNSQCQPHNNANNNRGKGEETTKEAGVEDQPVKLLNLQ